MCIHGAKSGRPRRVLGIMKRAIKWTCLTTPLRLEGLPRTNLASSTWEVTCGNGAKICITLRPTKLLCCVVRVGTTATFVTFTCRLTAAMTSHNIKILPLAFDVCCPVSRVYFNNSSACWRAAPTFPPNIRAISSTRFLSVSFLILDSVRPSITALLTT